MATRERSRTPARERIAQAFTVVEDVVYLGLGLLLAGAAAVQLVGLVGLFARGLLGGTLPTGLIGVLDQILLTLMIVEILYTVQVSYREHVLIPEPFILVALIAGVRRILVLTAEFSAAASGEKSEAQFNHAMIELGILTVLTVSLVVCLVVLRKRHTQAVAERA